MIVNKYMKNDRIYFLNVRQVLILLFKLLFSFKKMKEGNDRNMHMKNGKISFKMLGTFSCLLILHGKK